MAYRSIDCSVLSDVERNVEVEVAIERRRSEKKVGGIGQLKQLLF